MSTKPSPFRELGVTGRAQFGRVQYVDPDPALRGISAIRTYDEMRRTDPTGMAMFQVLSLPLRRVTWRCDPGGEKTTADQQAADFVWSCFNDMSHTFNDFIADACLMLGAFLSPDTSRHNAHQLAGYCIDKQRIRKAPSQFWPDRKDLSKFCEPKLRAIESIL